jgi:hypothetical protein
VQVEVQIRAGRLCMFFVSSQALDYILFCSLFKV